MSEIGYMQIKKETQRYPCQIKKKKEKKTRTPVDNPNQPHVLYVHILHHKLLFFLTLLSKSKQNLLQKMNTLS